MKFIRHGPSVRLLRVGGEQCIGARRWEEGRGTGELCSRCGGSSCPIFLRLDN